MKKYFLLVLLFSIIMTGCARHNQIDFSSSKAFFSSLNETKIIQKDNKKVLKESKIIQKENKKSTPVLNSLKKSKINNKNEVINKPVLLNLSSYEKLLEQKIGFQKYNILKIFNSASLIIKHGKIKNFQFHLKSCHLDLFFLDKGKAYIFKHFDIRPSTIQSKLDKKKCVEELNNKFTLIRDPK